MKSEALLHNRLVRFWGDPTQDKFNNFFASYGLFNGEDDAQNLVKLGAYLLQSGVIKRDTTKPYNQTLGLYNWVNVTEGNISFHVGVEYFLKGVFLYKGFAINERNDKKATLTKIKGSKSKLNPKKAHTLDFFIKNVPDVVDFSDFDKNQAKKNLTRGKKFNGIISDNYKNPTAQEVLNYVRLTRNTYLHNWRTIPEFKGITNTKSELFNYIAKQVFNKSIEEIAKLEIVYI